MRWKARRGEKELRGVGSERSWRIFWRDSGWNVDGLLRFCGRRRLGVALLVGGRDGLGWGRIYCNQ